MAMTEKIWSAAKEMEAAAKELMSDYGQAKKRLFIRICNRERNRERLSDVPHRDFLEFAVTCHIDMGDFAPGKAILAVNDSLLRFWGIGEEQLFEDAFANSPSIRPAIVKDIESLMAMLAGTDEPGMRCPIKAVTVDGLTHGAAAVLYPGVLEELAEQAGCPLLLIPSSVHEFLCLPETDGLPKDAMETMISEVNETVIPGDVLSGCLYRYDPADGRITPA